MQLKIAPSILNADFTRLGEDVARVGPHVDFLHLDVMDGHFVPNLSFGPPIIESLRRVSDLYFDCHLMVSNPQALFAPIKAAGGNLVTVHIEVHPDPTRVAQAARDEGLDFGLAINPPTPFEAVEPFVELCDLLLVMTVNPGFGGQGFIAEVLPKVEAARNLVERDGLAADIEVDGGVTPETVRPAREAGANAFVVGTAIMGAPDPVQAVARMRAAIESG